MSFDDARRAPVYEQALRTQDVLPLWPATTLSRKDMSAFHDKQVVHAGYRLDHLIRGALDPRYFRDFPSPNLLSAIKLFVETIGRKIEAAKLAASTRAFIDPRMLFCRTLLERADVILREHGQSPVTSDSFRQLILTHGYTVDDIVFNNPFYTMGLGFPRYCEPQKMSFLIEIERYWR